MASILRESIPDELHPGPQHIAIALAEINTIQQRQNVIASNRAEALKRLRKQALVMISGV
jgi:hypothetical protein